MKYQHLLFARSLSEDYRWMIVPSETNADELETLRQLFNSLDDPKDQELLASSNVIPIYCLHLPQMSYLVQYYRLNYSDYQGRPIYSLQGLAVPAIYRRHFWFALPAILASPNTYLNVWANVKFSDANQLKFTPSEKYSLNLATVDDTVVELASTQPSKLVPIDAISFDAEGFVKIREVIAARYFGLSDIAFGSTPAMTALLQERSLTVPLRSVRIQATSAIKKPSITSAQQAHPPIPTSGSTSSPDRMINDPEKDFVDPSERFNRRSHPSSMPKQHGESSTHSRSGFFQPFRALFGFDENTQRDDKDKQR